MNSNRTKIDLIFWVLSDAECDKLIEMHSWSTRKARVVNHKTWELIESPWRTNSLVFVNKRSNIAEKITNMIIEELSIKEGQIENFAFLKYEWGEEYKPHFDYFRPWKTWSEVHSQAEKWGQRIMTVLTYLSDDFDGGWTIFPMLAFTAKPRRWTSVVFRSALKDWSLDKNTLHWGEPVEKWIKYAIVTFIREFEPIKN